MHIGHYISGAAHAGLIGWVLVGDVFRADPPPLEVTDVAVISTEEFAALQRAQQALAGAVRQAHLEAALHDLHLEESEVESRYNNMTQFIEKELETSQAELASKQSKLYKFLKNKFPA